MKNIQLLKWEVIALVESKDDYKGGKKKKKKRGPRKNKKRAFY